jgi:hypothetical protein
MKKYSGTLLLCLFVTLLIASCSTSTKTGSRFGTWKKVSSTRGNWVGVHHIKSTAALGGHPYFKGKANEGDTTAIDTSYIDNKGTISMNIQPIQNSQFPSDSSYKFSLNIVDSSLGINVWRTHLTYSADSTVFDIPNSTGYNPQKKGVDIFNITMFYLCNDYAGNLEYLILSVVNHDSTKHKVYKIRVDGMRDIVDNIVAGCKEP